MNAEQFWKNVNMTGGEKSCWDWMRAKQYSGYGRVKFDFGDGAKLHGAHRVAFVLSGGETTLEKPHVLHSCDNKSCCNPLHLSCGSHSENMKQAHNRGLLSKPKNFHNKKLNRDQVVEIRRRISNGETRKSLAAEYGLSKSGMDHIAAERSWPD